MSTNTGIEWTKATWNPVVGCERVSPGCARCYAKTLHDFRHEKQTKGEAYFAPQYDQPFETVQLKPERLGFPLSWRTGQKIFVNSVSDLFHDTVPDEYIAAVFGVMGYAPRHSFQVLTKRPDRMRRVLRWMTDQGGQAFCHYHANNLFCTTARAGMSAWDRAYKPANVDWPLANVWLGVSVENQRWADERIPLLLDTPAAIRWLSCEPLLGPVDLTDIAGVGFDALHGVDNQSKRVDWVVVGGESGAGAREMRPEWAKSLRDQCAAHDTPFFFKQWGGETNKRGHGQALLDGVQHHAFPAVCGVSAVA